MLERSVIHADASAHSADVQRRLIAWLAEHHGVHDLTSMAPHRHQADDSDRSGRAGSMREQQQRPESPPPPSPSSIYQYSLLDAVVNRLLTMLYVRARERDDAGTLATSTRRYWATIELLASLQPAIACDLGELCHTLTSLFDPRFIPSEAEVGFAQQRARCEPHVQRLLTLYESRGHDLAAPVLLPDERVNHAVHGGGDEAEASGRPRSPPTRTSTRVSHVLLKGGWIDTLAEVVGRRPEIEVPALENFESRLFAVPGEREEWRALNRRKVAALRAAQQKARRPQQSSAEDGV